MDHLLITGAAGALGRGLVKQMQARQPEIKISAMDLDKNRMKELFTGLDRLAFYDLQDFLDGEIDFSTVDCVVHCAFARSQAGTALTASVEFTQKIFEAAIQSKVRRVINISSQSIYGNYRETPSSENGPINPCDLYGMAKYACEKISEPLFAGTDSQIIHVRMASLTGLAYPERIINKMAKFAVADHAIKIIGGAQVFSFLHVDDAVSGLTALINAPAGAWQTIYNLGTEEKYNIKDLAAVIAEITESKTGIPVSVTVEEAEAKHSIPLDVSAFTRDFQWRAKITLRDIVTEAVESQIS